MRSYFWLLLFAATTTLYRCADVRASERDTTTDATSGSGVFTADWESLEKYNESPEWFADSKLGIYFHWGPYTVPAFGSEWYPRNMYIQGSKEYQHHQATFGDQSEVGYHDLIPEFTGEHFDAAAWADLMQEAGARWGGPVAQHHDGFAMWDSDLNPWNAVDMGPKRDITGEMATALRDRGMKLITSFHHARNLQRNAADTAHWNGWSSHFPYHPDWATSSTEEPLRWLYGNVPEEDWNPYWFGQLKEVIDQYNPDIIWFDVWLNLIPENYRQEFCAYYLNHARERGQEVVIAHKKDDLPIEVSILDIEQGGKKDVSERVWLTDITLSNQSWSYVDGQTYKDPALVIRNFIDVVSKNGIVLLNISPKADGSIPEAQKQVLRAMGKWLHTYGEAIYDTRPRLEYGYGTAKADEGHFGGQSATVKYSATDVRFTESKDQKTIYAIFLGAPKPGQKVVLKSLKSIAYPPKYPVKRVSVLGIDEELEFAFDDHDNYVVLPEAPMNETATVVKIEME
ncbi:alpha-L-fucosidase [Flavilitoribacter nigricans DSM 23189 = NBRC 102662]|uniref:alpha-L-fucosidase n=2 Tax=Flavilitoribacter TaxID=2762562 RepID=A0A2D0N2N2_FLAN2|nr:alpha-L-fucosidase [Flavilitoribacter nigricans DSM 23189 = NBRC 102662]